jgi:tetrahydromethanopterin S-methyltransferase subunit A
MRQPRLPLAGDVVFGNPDSPVAVCALASRSLLPHLAGRHEIAIAGRVYTENVGVERMIKNLAANPTIRALILCGRESPHRSGQTVLSLHEHGLDAGRRVRGPAGPEPLMANLTDQELSWFRTAVRVVDMIGERDPERIAARARELGAELRGEASAPTSVSTPEIDVVSVPVSDKREWRYDPSGFFLIFARRDLGLVRLEHYGRDRRLRHVLEGTRAEDICNTAVRMRLLTDLAHAAYLGRELARAEAALRLGLHYEQDSPLNPARRAT